MATLTNESAFPTGDQNNIQPENGLTKREYFAAAALQGILANSKLDIVTYGDSEDIICYSVHYADELIKQLNK